MEALARAVGVTVTDLPQVSQAIIDEGVTTLALPLREKGRLSVALAKKSPVTSIGEHIEEESLAKAFPHRAQQKQARLLYQHACADLKGADADAQLRKEYIRKAKGETVDPVLTVMSNFLLFAPDLELGRRSLLALMLRVPTAQRLAVYNWHVAEAMPAAVVTSNGSAIANLQGPMFPHTEALEQLNERMWTGEIKGGGPRVSLWGGEPNIPLQQAQDGTFFIDGANIANAIKDTQEQINRLQQAQAQLQAQAQAQAHAHQPTAKQRQQWGQQPQQQWGQQPWRGRGRGGRGRGQGRGGVWGAGEDDDDLTPKNE